MTICSSLPRRSSTRDASRNQPRGSNEFITSLLIVWLRLWLYADQQRSSPAWLPLGLPALTKIATSNLVRRARQKRYYHNQSRNSHRSGDSSNDRRTDHFGNPNREFGPHRDELLLFRGVGPHVRRGTLPNIVLPTSRERLGAPLLFELVRPASFTASPKIKCNRTALNGTLQ